MKCLKYITSKSSTIFLWLQWLVFCVVCSTKHQSILPLKTWHGEVSRSWSDGRSIRLYNKTSWNTEELTICLSFPTIEFPTTINYNLWMIKFLNQIQLDPILAETKMYIAEYLTLSNALSNTIHCHKNAKKFKL